MGSPSCLLYSLGPVEGGEVTAPERAEGGGGGGEGVVSQVPKWKRDEEREDTRKNVRETTRPAHGASKHNIAAMLKLQKGNSDRPVTPPTSPKCNLKYLLPLGRKRRNNNDAENPNTSHGRRRGRI